MEKRDDGINIYELFHRRYRGFVEYLVEERGDYNPKQNVRINTIK